MSALGQKRTSFGDRLEAGQGVDQAHLRSLQEVLDGFDSARMKLLKSR
jgi:hypothetical protein